MKAPRGSIASLVALAAVEVGGCGRDPAVPGDMAIAPDQSIVTDLAWVPPVDGCTAPMPLDLLGLGDGTWWSGGTNVVLSGRRFYYEVGASGELGRAFYTLQVIGDDTMWSTSCWNDEGGYTVGNNVITCGCRFRLEVTDAPNKYLLNGKPFEMGPSPGTCIYLIGPEGVFSVICG